MSARKELLALLEEDNLSPSFAYWNSILNVYEKHSKDEFDLTTMRILCEESERCRIYWNTARMQTISFMKGMDDEPQFMQVQQDGENIKKGDVYPRIYDFALELEIRQAAAELEASRRYNPIEMSKQLICMPA